MKPTMEGKISNYDIAQSTGLWATDVHTIASRVGADQYAIIIPALDGKRKIERSVEAYTLADALKIADYVKANPQVRNGGIHHPPTPAETRIGADFERAMKLMALRA